MNKNIIKLQIDVIETGLKEYKLTETERKHWEDEKKFYQNLLNRSNIKKEVC